MTLLIERGKVQEACRFRPVIPHMSRGQNNRATYYWVRLSVLNSAPLTAVLCSVVPHEPAPQFPVCRVACFILGPYWHRVLTRRLRGTRRKARPLAFRYRDKIIIVVITRMIAVKIIPPNTPLCGNQNCQYFAGLNHYLFRVPIRSPP